MNRPGRTEQLRIAARLRLALRERVRLHGLPTEDRAAWRRRRLDELRRHAIGRSPLYQELHRGLEDAPLDQLPTITKADVVDRFAQLVTDPRLRRLDRRAAVERAAEGKGGGRRWRFAASSGSSGRPGVFVFDEREWVELLAAAAQARAIAGPPGVDGRVRAARIGSPSDTHLSRQLPATLHDPRKPSLTLSAAAGLELLVDELDRWKPHVVGGYPSVLAALADVQRQGRLGIEPVQVFSGGERLTAGARDLIRTTWNVEPFDQYLTTEAGFVAIECPSHDGLHVLDDHVVLEVVDADGRPTPPEVDGDKVLLTVLGSRTLPLIRYELDDVVALASGACACGRTGPRLRTIRSGTRDLIVLPAPQGGRVSVHPVAMTAVLDRAPVGGYQVVHESDEVRVLVAGAGPDLDDGHVVRGLQRALDDAGAAVRVRLERVDTLQRSTSGKAGLVVSRRTGAGTGPA